MDKVGVVVELQIHQHPRAPSREKEMQLDVSNEPYMSEQYYPAYGILSKKILLQCYQYFLECMHLPTFYIVVNFHTSTYDTLCISIKMSHNAYFNRNE